MEALKERTETKSLAEQMIDRLEELKMSKTEAAAHMNYSRPALSRYLNVKPHKKRHGDCAVAAD